jgi:3'(2'), 5'-bisphosphate nucleotidase
VPERPIDHADLARRLAGPVFAAGALILAHYKTGVAVETKSDQTQVTVADREAEELLLRAITAVAPGVPVVAEEAASRGEIPELGRRYFMVDPLDGTREFINRTGEFAINIGLLEDDRPVFGMLLAPAIGRLFVTLGADRAAAATVADPAAVRGLEELALTPIRTRAPGERLVALSSRSHLSPRTEAFLAQLSVAERIRIGSAVKFGLIAAGEADIYVRYGPTSEWDTAAGHAIVSAAGGSVLDPDGRPFLYGKRAQGFLNGPFVAWGRAPGN